MKQLVALAGFALAATATSAQFFDDFNRPDSGTLGSNWTMVNGSIGIVNNQAMAPNADFHYAVVNGYSDLPGNTVVSFYREILPALADAFPGALWFDRQDSQGSVPRARDVSPVARAFVAFREEAVPYVALLTRRDDPEVRFYATLLAGEWIHPDLVEPVGARLLDEDPATARLAAHIFRAYRRHRRDCEPVLEGVRAVARGDAGDAREQLVAVRALGIIRDRRAVELLVALLTDDRPELVQAAHRGLVSLTRQDFGRSFPKWAAWVDAHGKETRVEWLIDALAHPDETIRSAASRELGRLTHQYFGYHPSADKGQRELAQAKYRAWWAQEGAARYSHL